MTRCEICGNHWDNSLMYIQADGRTACVHCLDADERAEKMKTVEQHNAELIEGISEAIKLLMIVKAPTLRLAPNQPLDCKENHEQLIRNIRDCVDGAMGYLNRAIA